MKRKILLMSISYIIGTVGGLYLSTNIILFFYLILLMYIVITSKKIYKIIIVLTLIFSSSLAIHKNSEYVQFHQNMKECNIVGKVVNKTADGTYNKYLVSIAEVNGYKKYRNKTVIFYEKIKRNECEIGDVVRIKGYLSNISGSRNYKGFDYKQFLLTKNIYGIINVSKIECLVQESNNFYEKILNNTYDYIQNVLNKYLPQKNASLCIGIFLGNKDNIDTNVIDDFSDSSLSHILAISGMHVTYISTIILILFKFTRKSYSYIIVILCIIFFCNLVHNTESVVRASTMLILYYLSKLTHRKSDSLTSLSISSILILIRNPYSICSLNFILSYSGTLGIIFFYSMLEKKKIYVKNKIIRYVISQINLSISANLILIPIVAEYFNKVSLLFIISGPVSGILLSVIVPLIFTTIAFYPFSKEITLVASKLLQFFSNCLLYLSENIGKCKFLNILVPTPKIWEIIIYYVLIIYFYIRCKYGNNAKKIMAKVLKNLFIIYLLISISTYTIQRIQKELYIFFIDVGQGDSTLIISPENKKILIDRWRERII